MPVRKLSYLALGVAAGLMAFAGLTSLPVSASGAVHDVAKAEAPWNIPLRSLSGKPATLAPYKGKVMLLVNTASQCGYTPQYEGLQQLHERYSARGLAVLGFPCNQFGGQEPGTAAEISKFCTREYGVTFPMFAKIDVNGSDTHPLYVWLKQAKLGDIRWNFGKFLVDRKGKVVARYGSSSEPSSLAKDIEALL